MRQSYLNVGNSILRCLQHPPTLTRQLQSLPAFALQLTLSPASADNSISWRLPIALQCIFAFALMGLITFLPESPRWLVLNNQLAEAQRVVAALEPAPLNSDIARLQTKVILDSIQGMPKTRKQDVLTNGPTQHLRRMLLGSSSQIMQQIGTLVASARSSQRQC